MLEHPDLGGQDKFARKMGTIWANAHDHKQAWCDVVRQKGQGRDEIREANIRQIKKAFVCCSRRIKFYPAGYRKVFRNFKGKRSSVQFSCSVLSDSLWPHGLQHATAPCPSTTPRVYSNSCPPCLWSHPTISSVIIPFSSCLQSSQHQGLFKWVTVSQQVARVLEFHLQHQSSNEYSGLISFRMDCLDLLVVQGTLKKLLQHHSSKASILWHSAFFIIQLSHPYMTTGKTIALTKWTFVGKVMSLLLNMLSRLVITFLPRSSVF